jgi:hypothetical protein
MSSGARGVERVGHGDEPGGSLGGGRRDGLGERPAGGIRHRIEGGCGRAASGASAAPMGAGVPVPVIPLIVAALGCVALAIVAVPERPGRRGDPTG